MKRWQAGMVFAAAALAACGGDAIGPPTAEPGWLTVELSTTVTDAGGLVLDVSGGVVDSVRLAARYQGAARQAGPSAWSVLVVGQPLASGPLGTIHVPDVTQADRYVAAVRQAAARGTWQQRDPQAFGVVVRVP